jgi:hypothetical protein
MISRLDYTSYSYLDLGESSTMKATKASRDDAEFLVSVTNSDLAKTNFLSSVQKVPLQLGAFADTIEFNVSDAGNQVRYQCLSIE